MSKLKAVIIDDEIDSIESIKIIAGKFCPDLEIIAEANSAESGLEIIRQLSPDLVFLDIEMPQGSGFYMLDCIPNKKFQLIFITAYDQYAIKAFRENAIDYLLKPVNIGDFVKAVEKANENRNIRSELDEKLLDVKERLKKDKSGRIAVPSAKGLDFILKEDIVYVFADRSYSYLYLKNGEEMLTSKSLSEFEEILPRDDFFRVHKSYLVNIHCIVKYRKGKNPYIITATGQKIIIAKRRKNDFLAQMNTDLIDRKSE